MISTEPSIETKYVVPVPAYTGLVGNFQCSWRPMIEEAGVVEVKGMLVKPELEVVLAMIRQFDADIALHRQKKK